MKMRNEITKIKELIRENEGDSVLYIVNKFEDNINKAETILVDDIEKIKCFIEKNNQKLTIIFEKFGDGYEKNKELLKKIYNLLLKYNIEVILVIDNALNEEKILNLISGEETFKSITKEVSYAELKKMTKLLGLVEIESNDLELVAESEDYNTFRIKGTLLNDYFSGLLKLTDSKPESETFIRKFKAINIKQNSDENFKPFLSVITRTQAKRPESLRETLLSLAGQSCDDFEVLVMGHNLSDEGYKTVLEIIEEVPDFLKKRIKLHKVVGGNRSTPLNSGFEKARGEYAVILDDDDIVFDNWVSSFKNKAESHPGKVLHAYVIAQDWRTVETQNGVVALRACGSPQNQFCRDFHWLAELYGNYCPVLGLAFPMFPFRQLGLRFDETLDTTEDWDYLMRIVTLCNVVDIKEPTSIYRLWKNAENSYSLYDSEIWKKNHKKIQNKFRSKPLLIPGKNVDDIIRFIENDQETFGVQTGDERVGKITTLYLNLGKGYSEENTEHESSQVVLPNFRYEFLDLEKYGNLTEFRWDPYDRGMIAVDNLEFKITLTDGHVIKKTASQVHSNGFFSNKKIIIYHSDPQVIVQLPRKTKIMRIEITGRLETKINDLDHEAVLDAKQLSLLDKPIKYSKKIIKKMIIKSRG